MQAILISIKPKYVAKILNGEKTIEIRKTMPKCELPIDVYIYCTKDKKISLFDFRDDELAPDKFGSGKADKWFREHNKYLNGKVVAKFTLKKVTNMRKWLYSHKDQEFYDLLKSACLSTKELHEYAPISQLDYEKGKSVYALHIDDLVIFDKPKELWRFKQYKKYNLADYNIPKLPKKHTWESLQVVSKAPQSWCYVEVE